MLVTRRMAKKSLLLAMPAATWMLVTWAMGATASAETWYERTNAKAAEVAPRNLAVLSLQVSKLPRSVFGGGLGPQKSSHFLSSWVVGSGTGLYGTFELERPGTLIFQRESSLLLRFVDNHGRDLTPNPGKEKFDTFFEGNRPVQVDVSRDQSTCVFTLRGYLTPTRGATSLTAEARLLFLNFSEEQTTEKKNVKFKAGTEVTVGPVRLKIHTPADLPQRKQRRSVSGITTKKAKWAVVVQSRSKPVETIELLDGDGKVLIRSGRTKFEGHKYTWYVNETKTDPVTVRVTWYEKWERISVPIKISTPLGI